MQDNVDLVLKVVAWGIIAFIVLIFVLRGIGIIHSPELENMLVGWLTALSIEVMRLGRDLRGTNVKLDLLWKDLKRRKRI
jgi:preprotein translocase subunit SecD